MKTLLATFSSDYHLGLRRNSHTTPASRDALEQAMFDAALVASTPQSDAPSICLGDLFDKFSNNEKTILQGLKVLRNLDAVIPGNHDSSNREGVVSSLRLCSEARAAQEDAPACDPILWEAGHADYGSWLLYSIPHQMTQGAFEAELQKAQELCANERTCDRPRSPLVLALHCNYSQPAADKAREDTLNLTRDKARKLLEVFDYILIGHEHNARTDFDGRVICVGSVFPTSFADCKTDKYVWKLWSDGRLEKERVWSAEDGYQEIPWEDLERINNPEVPWNDWWDSVQFIEITGTAPASKMPEIAKAVHKLWTLWPSALMIRNAVEVEEVSVAHVSIETGRLMSIPDQVTAELKDNPLAATWAKYLAKAENQ